MATPKILQRSIAVTPKGPIKTTIRRGNGSVPTTESGGETGVKIDDTKSVNSKTLVSPKTIEELIKQDKSLLKSYSSSAKLHQSVDEGESDRGCKDRTSKDTKEYRDHNKVKKLTIS